jgi:hypothetical protein
MKLKRSFSRKVKNKMEKLFWVKKNDFEEINGDTFSKLRQSNIKNNAGHILVGFYKNSDIRIWKNKEFISIDNVSSLCNLFHYIDILRKQEVNTKK